MRMLKAGSAHAGLPSCAHSHAAGGAGGAAAAAAGARRGAVHVAAGNAVVDLRKEQIGAPGSRALCRFDQPCKGARAALRRP